MSIAGAEPGQKLLLTSISAIGTAALLFSLPALYNGFPFIFGDTPWYLFLTSFVAVAVALHLLPDKGTSAQAHAAAGRHASGGARRRELET
jgi:hypothetical protein